jgi:hypothetical protein
VSPVAAIRDGSSRDSGNGIATPDTEGVDSLWDVGPEASTHNPCRALRLGSEEGAA